MNLLQLLRVCSDSNAAWRSCSMIRRHRRDRHYEDIPGLDVGPDFADHSEDILGSDDPAVPPNSSSTIAGRVAVAANSSQLQQVHGFRTNEGTRLLLRDRFAGRAKSAGV